MSRIQNAKNALISQLSDISDFVMVSGFADREDGGFPFATVIYRGGESEQSEIGRFQETHNFDVTVCYVFEDAEEQENALIYLVEKVLDKIDEDRSLLSTVHNCRIADFTEEYMEDDDKIRAIKFSIETVIFK